MTVDSPKPKRLTIIIRDNSPAVHLNEPVSFRRVTIELTEDQAKQLEMKPTHSNGMNQYFEETSHAFLEF